MAPITATFTLCKVIFVTGMRPVCVILLLLLALQAQAQVYETFTDGELHFNPKWVGDTTEYRVVDEQLQLKGIAGGASYVSTPSTRIDGTSWKFTTRIDFSPSAANRIKFYLASDEADLEGSLKGYFIQIGETGSADGVDLYRQDDMKSTQLIDGTAGFAASGGNFTIVVHRDHVGNWSLYADSSGNNKFTLQGQVLDSTYKSTSHSGLLSEYTSTRKDKIWWDDIYVGQPLVDSLPPHVHKFSVLDGQHLELEFNEPLQAASATNIANYVLLPNILPLKAEYQSNSRKVVLKFNKPFPANKQQALELIGLKDSAGNRIRDTMQLFTHFSSSTTVIINELMVDPTPEVGLGAVEYIELFNYGNDQVNLSGWTIEDVTSVGQLSGSMPPQSYLVLCAPSAVDSFVAGTILLAVASLPSLNNGGDELILKSADTAIADRVSYNLSWYGDQEKADGGYSLERKHPKEGCKGAKNWAASFSESGGTPGYSNSVAQAADTIAPNITQVVVLDSQHVKVQLSEALVGSNFTANSLEFIPHVAIASATLSTDRAELVIELIDPLEEGSTYLVVFDTLADCLGNQGAPVQYIFTTPVGLAEGSAYSVLITEVFANSSGVTSLPKHEYLELYNRTDQAVELENWSISDLTSSSFFSGVLLQPHQYAVVVSAEAEQEFVTYGKVIRLPSLPQLNNEEDQLVLKDGLGNYIHSVAYTSSWHTTALKRKGGWSLEMIDITKPCLLNNNWTSSLHASGGTPAKENSVHDTESVAVEVYLTNLTVLDENTLELSFNESLNVAQLEEEQNYTLSHSIDHPDIAIAASVHANKVRIYFIDSLEGGVAYRLSVSNISNCVGDQLEDTSISFSLPSVPVAGDIVINEILFHPNTGGKDYLEIYNTSPTESYDLQKVYIATLDPQDELADIQPLFEDKYMLAPQKYLAVTEDVELLKKSYSIPFPSRVLPVKKLPLFPETAGHIQIRLNDGTKLDEVAYSSSWHYKLLANDEGVSLEKLNPRLPSSASTSWQSASSYVGYGTPGYQNSQYQDVNLRIGSEFVHLDPQAFSPDGDGYNDVLNIYFNLPKGGYSARVYIFNSRGVLVKKLVDGRLLGTHDHLKWDGISDEGNKASVGVYIILAEFWNAEGEVHKQKLEAQLLAKLGSR